MKDRKHKPLFMWAGGKNKMIKKYLDFLPNDFNVYVEPFFGGGALFLWAYEKNPEATFILNDVNVDIMNIYKSVKNNVEDFTTEVDLLSEEYLKLEKSPATKENGIKEFHGRAKYFYDLRHEHAYHYSEWSSIKQAAVLYFLMKTGFNGIWQINKNTNNRFGTPAGLLNQKDKVYNKEDVYYWSKALKNAIIINEDFSCVEKYLGSETFLFLDPPYRNSFTQYNVDFDDEEQKRVINLLHLAKSKGTKAFLSNRDGDDLFFESLCQYDTIRKFDVTYTAGRRKKTENGFEAKKAREVLIF